MASEQQFKQFPSPPIHRDPAIYRQANPGYCPVSRRPWTSGDAVRRNQLRSRRQKPWVKLKVHWRWLQPQLRPLETMEEIPFPIHRGRLERFWDTLWWTNIAMENGHLEWIFPLKIVIFHCYVSSSECNPWRLMTSNTFKRISTELPSRSEQLLAAEDLFNPERSQENSC